MFLGASTSPLIPKTQPQLASAPDPAEQQSNKSHMHRGAIPKNHQAILKIQSAVDQMNHQLQHEDRQVVFDYDAKAHRIWLNLVDKNTGQVIEEMPPKVIRQLVDSLGDIKGLIIDKRS